MSYGIRVENPQGRVQIDQDYVNYMEVVNTSFYLPKNDISKSFFPEMGFIQIIGYKKETNDIVCINTGHKDNVAYVGTTLDNGSSNDGISYIVWPLGSNATYRVKIFREVSKYSASSTEDYGLNVYKSDGSTLAFSSSFKSMRLAGVLTAEAGDFVSMTLSSGTPYIGSNTSFVISEVDGAESQYQGATFFNAVSADSTKAYVSEGGFSGGSVGYRNRGIYSTPVVKG